MSGTGRWISVLAAWGPAFLSVWSGPFFVSLIPVLIGCRAASTALRFEVNRSRRGAAVATRYTYGSYLRQAALKGRKAMAKATDEIRAGCEADEVDARRGAPAEAERRSFRREQPESHADDAAGNEWRDHRHDPAARQQVIRLASGVAI